MFEKFASADRRASPCGGARRIGSPMRTAVAVAAGKIFGDYYNVMAQTGFRGHMRYSRCASIASMKRPFMGRSSAFVAFINADSGIMFKISVGRDEKAVNC
jgi:putative heme iron utilization protein